MESQVPDVLIIAQERAGFVRLGGISLLERQLRVLQRLGFRSITICSDAIETVAAQLGPTSWARSKVALDLRSRPRGAVTIGEVRAAFPTSERILFCSEGYCDRRLWGALARSNATTLLIDSAPPVALQPLWEDIHRQSFGLSSGIALLEQSWLAMGGDGSLLFHELWESARVSGIETIDAAKAPPYVTGQRRDIRPLWFPVPAPEYEPLAESVLLDGIQNGVLDLPALVHAPIETAIVRRLSRTSIRPNQVTFLTVLIGMPVTWCFFTGQLWLGTAGALAIGILDGVDGKLARLKIETTELGKTEHALDYAIELSWWTALAYFFSVHALGARSWILWFFLVGSDLIARGAKGVAKKTTGRNLDDVENFDRRFRLVAGRRNIYIWVLAAGLILGVPAIAFQLFCGWGVVSAAVHTLRAWQIRVSR